MLDISVTIQERNENGDLLNKKEGLKEFLLKKCSKVVTHFFRVILMVNLVIANLGYCEALSYMYTLIDFRSYFFLSWFANSMLIVPIPVVFLKYFKPCQVLTEMKESKDRGSTDDEGKENDNKPKKKSYLKILPYCLILAPIQLFSSFIWFQSMKKIPVAVNLSLYQSMNLVIFVGSVLFLWKSTRRHIIPKFFTFIACVVGVVLLSTIGGYGGGDSDRYSKHDYFSGVILTIIAAALMGLFSVMYQIFFGSLAVYDAILVQCCNGFITLVLYWVFIPIFNAFGFEPVFTMEPYVVVFIITVACLQSYFYLSNALLVAFSNALYSGICLSSSIGMSIIVDFLVFGIVYNTNTIISIAIIFMSTLGINMIEVLPAGCDPFFGKKKKKKEEENEAIDVSKYTINNEE